MIEKIMRRDEMKMIRFDEIIKPIKLKSDTGVYMILAGLLSAIAGIFVAPAPLGFLSVILSFLGMKSPKGAWGIPVFLFGTGVIISSLYR